MTRIPCRWSLAAVRAVGCQPEVFEIQLALGEGLLQASRLQDAKVHLDNARRQAPNDPRLVKALELLRQREKDGPH